MKKWQAFAAAGCLALSAAPAMALDQGDMLVRFGPTWVMPNDDSGAVSANGTAIAGSGVEVDNGVALGISFTYMMTPNLGVEVLAATPFSHDVKGKGSLQGEGTIATIKHLPPTVSLQYHFSDFGQWRPYVGAGINYTTFFDEKGKGNFAGADVSLKDSWGWALQAGMDFDVNDRWFVGASAYYIAIDTTATIRAGADTVKVDVDIDPWVLMVGGGLRF
ncbi:outer membrane protein W [Thioalkalivibrio sulfidiphilus HL-EbGr7]|uniref:Outer membrane protein W n=1 Tax=Thioalkalivibrio sulfidiphilus (strain HL-EbGR7) TaxID=396588 RepID=B8GM23_THISH|nr:OmpW family outer membrane protein [Thioalkalivibrio sulfidiphilus]ACL73610.1 outer membrane protein W [Thioalkalivibrio sulfidiphilus HL-EbGr7]